MLRPGGKDGTQTQETQFNKYQKLGGGWMAPEVIFMIDGKVVTTEKYSDIRGDMTLDPKTVRSTVLDHGALEGMSADSPCLTTPKVFANFSPGFALKPWGSRPRFVLDATLKGLRRPDD